MERLGTPGSIVLTASISGHITNPVSLFALLSREMKLLQTLHLLAYNTSKSAVLQMARSLACELAPKGIRVNSISPGYIVSECVSNLISGRICMNDVQNDPRGVLGARPQTAIECSESNGQIRTNRRVARCRAMARF